MDIVSLFSGAGGLDLGFEQQGFRPLLAYDSKAAAVSTYNFNRRRRRGKNPARIANLGRPGAVYRILRDIIRAGFTKGPIGIVGGPPCQYFSNGNKAPRRAGDVRRILPRRYAKILSTLNKSYDIDFFILENVEGLAHPKHRSDFKKILRLFDSAGFHTTWKVLDAHDYGVPQHRKRVFVIGWNKRLYPDGTYKFPHGKPCGLTVATAIRNLPEPVYFAKGLDPERFPLHPNHWTMVPKSEKFWKPDKPAAKPFRRSFRRLLWNRPSYTVAYGHNEIHVHPNGRRRLSIYEAMLLQGFPRGRHGYTLVGHFSEQVALVSDAVPPPLASALAASIKKFVSEYRGRPSKKKDFASAMLSWFVGAGRQFPWRQTRRAYRVLLAEKLLQQTSVRRGVVDAYNELVHAYPDPEQLTAADPRALAKLFRPLGLSYRAKDLVRMARDVVSRFDGRIPRQLTALLSLYGVGDYSARAILSFAYGQDVPVVDTNVGRILYRAFGIPGKFPQNPARSRRLTSLAGRLLPAGKSREFNWAMIDLGALVCLPKNPLCGKCPINHLCDYQKVQPSP